MLGEALLALIGVVEETTLWLSEESAKMTACSAACFFIYVISNHFKTFPANLVAGHLRSVHQVRSNDPTF